MAKIKSKTNSIIMYLYFFSFIKLYVIAKINTKIEPTDCVSKSAIRNMYFILFKNFDLLNFALK